MDLRKEKSSQLRKSSERYGGPQQNTRNISPYAGQPDRRYGNTAGERDVTDNRVSRDYGGSLNQSYGQRLASPQDQDSNARIEQRHEELKRQIALKEQQLAEMTNERDTARRLRNKLGLDRNPSSGKNMNDDRSRSPINEIGMGGYRSSHLTGQNRQELNQSSKQPLQFYPTRLEARPQMTATQSSQSPLRNNNQGSRKGSQGRLGDEEEDYNPRPTYNYNPASTNDRSISPYSRGGLTGTQPAAFRNTGGIPPRKTSPLRATNATSSVDLIKPQPISNNFVSKPEPNVYVSTPDSLGGQDLKKFSGPGARAQLYRDRIEAMTIDNSSLQRRLNQVGAELDRITQEKEELHRQLEFHEHDNNRIQSMIENKDDTDMTNQAMQEDLNRNKQENIRLQQRLKEEEIEQKTTGSRLMDTNVAKKNLELEGDTLNANLSQKLRHMDELSKERVVVLQELHQANNELERLNRQHLTCNHENIDMETHMQRLQSERHELLRNLEQLTITYDDCVRDITRERRNMDAQNDWQTKLIVTKIIFEHISMFQKVRRQRAMKELQNYVHFDKVCHEKLKTFSNCLHKLGHFKMKIALNQWYDKSLKPLPLRHQNEDISIVIQANRLQAKVFYAWKQFQQNKMDRYLFKTNAIEKIWFLMNRGAKKEMKRAMTIWKLRKQFNVHKYKRLRDIIAKRNKENMQKAMLRWQTKSNLMLHCARVRILQIETSQKLYLSQVFYQMRYTLRKEKQMRQRTLNSIMKAWKDHIHYNRHLMQTNMAAIQFVQTNNRFILKNCFDELRYNREKMKHMTLDIAVNDDVDIAIRATKQQCIDKEKEFLTKNQLRCGFIVRAMLGKKLFSYFHKWKYETNLLRTKCKTKVYDRLIKIYRNYQFLYFQRWKDQNNLAVMQKRSKIVHDIELQNSAWHKEALANEKNIQYTEDQIRMLKRRLIDKTFRKLFFKRLSQGMKRWKKICNLRGSQEDQAAFLIKKLRKRYLNDAFTSYLRFYKKSLQHDANIGRANHMRLNLTHKRMRKVFNAICFETNRQKTSQKYWRRIFGKVDHFMKAKALKTWLMNANLRHENQLVNHQDRLIAEISQRNQEIKRCEETDYVQKSYIENQIKTRRNKAYKLLGNYFMRMCTAQTAQKFRIWKDRVDQIIHKQGVLIKTLQHWKKSQFLMLRSVLVKFMSQDRQREYYEQIRQAELDQEMIDIKRKQRKEQQNLLRQQEQLVIKETIHASAKRGEEYNKLMSIIERRQQEWVFGSKKRMIFMCWRHAVKQQKAFLLCVENVLTRSMQFRGFDAINTRSKNVLYAKKVNRTLNKLFARLQISNTATAMTKWKLTVASKVQFNTESVQYELSEKQREFEEWVSKCKDTNNSRCLLFFAERNAKNIFRGWVNVVKSIQLFKNKELKFQQKQQTLQKCAALKKLRMRVDKTIQSRFRTETLIRQFQLKYRKASFVALVKNYKNLKHMCTAISNLEKMMRDKVYGDSFRTVRSFAVSKGLVYANCKKKAAEDLYNLVKQQYNKRIRVEFQRYKRKCMTDEQKMMKLKQMLGTTSSCRVRDAFFWWKDRNDLMELKDDMADTGPVRAQYWEAKKEIENLKDFMREERFTEQEIKLRCREWFGKNDNLMQKYIARFRLRQDPKKKLMPKVWNNWRQYTAMRKLIKYQLQQMQNNMDNVKADLQRAFKKWKNGPEQLAKQLWKLPLARLQDLGIKSTKMVADCSDTLAENQSIQNHLLIQRDEFLNYYVKSQILAMALLKDRAMYAKMQAISRWLWRRKLMNKKDLLAAIRDAAYMQANLEAKQSYYDENNEHLTGENAELGQFTDDGTVIRKNMERLRDERDKLKKSMDDSEQDYQDLLAENERLKKLVEDAELRAKTNKNRAFQKTFKIQVELKEDAEPIETEAQKNARLRMEKLQKMGNLDETENEKAKKLRFENEESEADRQKRLRFEKLEKKQIAKGPSLR